MKEMSDGPNTWMAAPTDPHLVASQRRPLAEAAAELEAAWHLHVERAEGRGGLHAFLCAASPGYLPMVVHLQARQRHILADLQRLQALALRSSMGRGWLRAEYGRLAQALVAHDELETEALCAALEERPRR